MQKGICHLCKYPGKKLHGKSHIIPKWMYDELKEEKAERLLFVNFQEFKNSTELGDLYKPVKPVNSPFDERWYCIDCEMIFEKLDNFSAKFLKGGNIGNGNAQCETVHHNLNIVRHPEVWRWRMFVLSLVYRMHCSCHRFYSGVNIGNSAENIRELLLNKSYDERVLGFDIVTLIADNRDDNNLHAFSTTPNCNKNEDNLFVITWGIWGIWFLVGEKYPIFSSYLGDIPNGDKSSLYFSVISKDLSKNILENDILRYF